MYKLHFTPTFAKARDRLITRDSQFAKKLKHTLQLLANDPKHTSLNSHKVNTIHEGIRWSSWVTDDIRVIWDYGEQLVLILIDLGGHSGKYKVYKN